MATVNWRSLDERVRIQSKWVTLIAEKWLTDTGETLEYWRVEKADSVIVLPLQGKDLICLPLTFRVGVQRVTVDFPGGRVGSDQDPIAIVPQILTRELGITANVIQGITPISEQPWLVNIHHRFLAVTLYPCVELLLIRLSLCLTPFLVTYLFFLRVMPIWSRA
ncbi:MULTISPECIES: hypothetical protein [unclassified Thermosynechococcus]|uniref:hypothetical protein n=1 Tax=unclassified Thermosynechococcus TaxID=2622553 RepID=UPI00197F75A5|nr:MULTISPECIES: hypothetical protein [unclassified Thermosynechococcus]QSF48692.1 hypothetical protein JW907_10135 [Thermosynechococcus sp. TA-1]WNC21740.1 hypothetical protein RHG98_10130 [Thermosynechococcus sp. PP22]WNC31978.1 hypothetical protein RHH81_10090 [Thermosynechococcus sp. PKX95]WNC34507.1 hypothetical protein RHH79_10090 [Thermosynechococcus sp. PKX91]WNC52206.1 hypothetical protein RHJ02_10155 [Thermosynechococcus sp. TG215]